MANKAWLTKRVKIDGQWMKRQPVVGGNGVLTDKVVHNNTTIHAPGVFVLEWHENGKRQYRALTEDRADAALELRNQQARLEGVPVADAPNGKGKITLRKAVDEYLEECKLNRAHKTHLAYKRALEMLVACSGCNFVTDLSRRSIMVHFIKAMKDAGLADRTQNNLFGAVVTFLHANGHPVVTRKDAPSYTETEIETYTDVELASFFAACTPVESLTFEFFLNTGCREREVEFATWKDIDWQAKTYTVKAKPAMGFKPKDYEERTIPLSDSLIGRLKVWKAKNRNTLLIFPNGQGRPNGHLLRDLKNVAKNTKLNCGHCESTHFGQPVTCKTHAVCEQWYLHKFRHTFACMQLLGNEDRQIPGIDIRTLQLYLGHSDLETTSVYLKAIQGKQKSVRQKVNSIFAGVPVKPMTQDAVPTIQ